MPALMPALPASLSEIARVAVRESGIDRHKPFSEKALRLSCPKHRAE